MILLKELNPLKEQLVRLQENKFRNTPFAVIFNESHLKAISDDIILKMEDKLIEGELDKKGIYNYFRTSFKFKCIDEIKKYNCEIRKNSLNQSCIEDVSFLLEDSSNKNSPEKRRESQENIKLAMSELKNYQKRKPLAKILEMVLEGYNIKEIQETLNISSSSLDRYKKEIIQILRPLNLQETILFDPECKPNHIKIDNLKKNVPFLLYKIFNFNKEKNKTEAKLFIKREEKHVELKQWSFKHTDLDKINKVIDEYNILPHLETEEKKLYVSK